MADPIRKLDNPDAPEPPQQAPHKESAFKSAFKKAGKGLIIAQMYYKTASLPEKVVLQFGIHAAFFIPLNNIVGCFLLYDDYQNYKIRKTKSPEPISFSCVEFHNNAALAPLACKHYIHHDIKQENKNLDSQEYIISPKSTPPSIK